MNKKIVFLADCLVTQKAGIHFYTKQFIERVTAQYPDNQYHIVLPYQAEAIDIPQIIVPIKRWLPFHFRLRSMYAIPRAVKELQPDLVIEMAHFGPFFLPASIKKATVIYDLTPIYHPEWHDKLSHFIHKIFLPGIIDRADYLLTISEQSKGDLVRFRSSSADKTFITYPALEKKIPDTIEDPTGILESEKYMLSVGTIEPRKNYTTLIRAFDKVAAGNKNIKLRIVGYKGWKSAEVFTLIERSSYKDRIILEGYTTAKRLVTLYQHATAFVFPSLYEGFGMPVLEAMSYGLPVICSDIPTSREICQDNALYFEKTDVGKLAENIAKVFQDEDLRSQYAAQSRARFDAFNTDEIKLDMLFS